MYRNLMIGLALVACAQQASAQQRVKASIYLDPAEYTLDHPADRSILRAVNLNPVEIPVTDYPAAARRAGHKGEVAIEVRIGADDRILDCRVTTPATSADLTAAACPLVRRRATFRHALANDGNPREAVMSLKMEFYLLSPSGDGGEAVVYVPPAAVQLPGKARRPEVIDRRALTIRGASPSLFKTESLAVNLTIDATGRVTRCSIFLSSGTDQGDMLMCRTATAARFTPGRNAHGVADSWLELESLTLEP